MCVDGIAQGVEVVSTFENGGDSAVAGTGGEGGDHAGEFGEIQAGELEIAERVIAVGVEAGRDEDEVGVEEFGAAAESGLEGGGVLVPAGIGWQGDIESESFAAAFTAFAGFPGARVEG